MYIPSLLDTESDCNLKFGGEGKTGDVTRAKALERKIEPIKAQRTGLNVPVSENRLKNHIGGNRALTVLRTAPFSLCFCFIEDTYRY